jgi:hypothetical protein
MQRIFSFDPIAYRDQYADQGWIHIRNGISAEFLDVLRDFTRKSFEEHKVAGRAIGGTKEQSLYEFPSDVDFPNELFDVVATVCGLNRSTMTLSERHIKAYDADANPDPVAHKDRFASQVSMGLSIDIPSDSRLVLYPHEHRGVNPFNVSAAFRHSLDPDQRPEVVLRNARAVEIADSGGDVVMFPGSSMWHLRRNSAHVVNLYLKFNDFNSDPLSEDPSTAELRSRTLALLDAGGDDFDGMVPVIARRMDAVSRQYTRHQWEEVLLADVWGEDPVRITQAEFGILRAVDSTSDVAALTQRLSVDGMSPDDVRAGVRRLVERGVLDLTA